MGLFKPPDIGKLKSKRDLKGLLVALKHKSDAGVRKEAALALAELAESLPAETRTGLVQPLLAALDDSDYQVTVGVVQALGAIGQPAVLPLITALRATARTRA